MQIQVPLGDDLEVSPETPLLDDDHQERGEDDAGINDVPRFVQWFRKQVAPFIINHDMNGSGGWDILAGLTSLTSLGIFLGIILPHNNTNLPTPWYRPISSSIGYTYFLCWSVSFYPQLISNYSRKSTLGLSTDFCALNTIGFVCYAVYNASFFFLTSIQEVYRERHGGSEVTVQSNDVAFAVHAFLLSSVTWFQVGYYHGSRAMIPSRVIGYLGFGIVISICSYIAVVAIWKQSTWLDFLYFLSYIKVFVSLIKYTPQILMNSQRKSTQGWSIWNILLDFSGGILSVVQLVLDCADMGDWTGITGNAAKFVLGNVSIVFDIIFMMQHYVLYRDRATPEDSPSQEIDEHINSEEALETRE